jgi:hypothetical protein
MPNGSAILQTRFSQSGFSKSMQAEIAPARCKTDFPAHV